MRSVLSLLRELTLTLSLLAIAVVIVYLLLAGHLDQALKLLEEILTQLGEIP